MLTADLVRARVRGPTLRPQRPDLDDPALLGLAERVHLQFVEAAAERQRLGEVLTELDEATRELGDPKLGKGLVRVAQDRAETESSSVADPGELRLDLFRRAAARGPIALAPEPGRVCAAELLAEVGRERQIAPEQLAEDLYADLPSERRIASYDVPDPGWLLRRYDVALVQALLLSATELKLVFERPKMPRMRQLLRWVKFHQLLHSAHREGEGLELRLDGPMSLFGPSTRYGLALAQFFPAVLLQDPPWRLEATVLWTRSRQRKQLVVSSEDGYVSHYPDTGAYQTRTQQHFAARFAEREREWRIEENVVPVALSDRELVLPDFALVRADRTVHLEIVGYWRPETLARRLAALDTDAGRMLVLAVSRKLAGAKGAELPEHPRLVPYTDVVSVEKVLKAAESCEPPRRSNGRRRRASEAPAGSGDAPDPPW
jgi:hypothetical protein